jgi:hypothetical protein
VTTRPISPPICHAVLAVVANKYPDLRVTIDEILDVQHFTVDAVFDADQLAWRMEPRRQVVR